MNSSTPPNTPYQARFAKLQQITERLPNQPSHDKAIWRDSTGTLRAKLGEQEVTSKLWPIFSHRAGVPLAYFAQADLGEGGQQLEFTTLEDTRHIAYDRLLRALHTMRFFSLKGVQNELLFLNVHQRFLSLVTTNHGKAFRAILDSMDIPAEQVVLQIVSEREDDLALFGLASASYKAYGFKVGLHASKPQSTLALLQQLRPDYLTVPVSWSSEQLQQLNSQALLQGTHTVARQTHDIEEVSKVIAAGIDLSTPADLTASC